MCNCIYFCVSLDRVCCISFEFFISIICTWLGQMCDLLQYYQVGIDRWGERIVLSNWWQHIFYCLNIYWLLYIIFNTVCWLKQLLIMFSLCLGEACTFVLVLEFILLVMFGTILLVNGEKLFIYYYDILTVHFKNSIFLIYIFVKNRN